MKKSASPTPKLNKSQYAEFARSAITKVYADLNFKNCPSKLAATLLNPNGDAGKALMFANPICKGGWLDRHKHVFKPKSPRSEKIKYESLVSGCKLWEVAHPCDIQFPEKLYFVEGWKKGVAVAQHFGGRVLVFDSLGHGLGLLNEIETEAAKYSEVYFCPDNDEARQNRSAAEAICKAVVSGCRDAKVAKFFGKGIDDALVDGVAAISWVAASTWRAISPSCDGWDVVEKARFFSDIKLLKGVRLYVLKGEKGTGKSYQMERMARAALAEGRTVIVVVHRIALGMDLARRLGIPYIDGIEYKGTGSVVLCINSIQKLKIDESLAGAVVFIDESDQVERDMWFSTTMKHNRTKIVAKFRELGATICNQFGGTIVISSADISDQHVKDMQELFSVPAGTTYKIWNQYIPEKGNCYFSLGVTKTPDSSKFKQYDGVLKVLELAKAGKRLFIHTSAQEPQSIFGATVLESLLNTALGDAASVVRIDSETNRNPEHPAYRAASKIKQLCLSYQIVIATNTIGTGVDINFDVEEKLAGKPIIDAVIEFANGVTNDSDSSRQASGRYRNWQCDRYVFAQPSFEIPHDSISNKFLKASDFERFKLAQEQCFKEFDSSFFESYKEQAGDVFNLSIQRLIRHNIELINEAQDFGAILRNKLEQLDNYNVIDYECSHSYADYEAIHKVLKELSELLQAERIEEIAKAPDISDDEYKELLNKTAHTEAEVIQINAHQIRKRYGLEPTPQVQELIENGTLGVLKNNWWLTDGYEVGLKIAEQNNYHRSKNGINDLAHDFIAENHKILQAKVLQKIKFIERCESGVSQADARQIIADIIEENPNNRLLFNLPHNWDIDETKRANHLLRIAKNFGFKLERKCVRRNGQPVQLRYLAAHDINDATDNKSIKEKLVAHWAEYYAPKVQAWDSMKADFTLIKDAQKLNTLDASLLTGQNPCDKRFRYASLATRAKCLGSLSTPPKWQWAHESPKEFKAWLKSVPSLAVDIETYSSDPNDKMGGLNHETGLISVVTLSNGDFTWIARPEDLKGQFRRHFRLMFARRTQRKVGHNFLFDLRFLAHAGLVGKIRNVADTMLGSRCLLGDLGAAQITKHSLQQACRNFLGIEISKNEQTSDWAGELTEAQLNYATLDAWYTFVLDKRLQELCANPALIGLPMPTNVALKHWEIRNASLPAFIGMGLTGYSINENRTIIEEQRRAKLAELRNEWDAICPGIKHTQSAKLLEHVNKKYGLNLQSLNKQNVVGEAKVRELELRQTLVAIEKDLDIVAKVATVGNRHAPVITACSGTGRTSSGATRVNKRFFNMQSLPARVNPAIPKSFGFLPLKAMFGTDCVIDLPASHGRISAELANDDYAIRCYTDDSVDMHCDTASIIAQIVYAEDEAARFTSAFIKERNKATDTEDGRKAKGLRDTAKNTYYGWLNGAGAGRIKEQIQNNLGIEVSRDKCQQALTGMQNNFSKTVTYSKSVLDQLEDSNHQFIVDGKICAYMEFAGVYLCWVLGTVGSDIKVPATKAFASIWSCTESLLMNKAIADIHEKFDSNPQWGAALQNFIHDELNIEYKDIEAARYAYAAVKNHFAEICPNTVSGFDKFEKCVATKDRPIKYWSDK